MKRSMLVLRRTLLLLALLSLIGTGIAKAGRPNCEHACVAYGHSTEGTVQFPGGSLYVYQREGVGPISQGSVETRRTWTGFNLQLDDDSLGERCLFVVLEPDAFTFDPLLASAHAVSTVPGCEFDITWTSAASSQRDISGLGWFSDAWFMPDDPGPTAWWWWAGANVDFMRPASASGRVLNRSLLSISIAPTGLETGYGICSAQGQQC